MPVRMVQDLGRLQLLFLEYLMLHEIAIITHSMLDELMDLDLTSITAMEK